jgi:Icc-related predicted phosphoesterase
MREPQPSSSRIWLLSDLHQEFLRDPVYRLNPLTRFDPAHLAPDNFDVVVLAGDIDVPLSRSIDWAAERFAGVPIVYVPGNHDFYVAPGDPVLTVDELQNEGREAAARTGVHLLMDDEVEIRGVRYLGGTLWTDFNLGGGSRAAHIAEARGSRGMNDYKSIRRWSTKQPGKRKSLRPEDTIAAHVATRSFLSRELEERPNSPTVVVTHHAPLSESVDVNKRLSWCYANRMEYLFDGNFGPALWLHGHIHDPVDYQRGTTRIVSNPRGYAFAEKQHRREFDPALVLEVTTRSADATS